jgi:hypothetical protein
MKKSHPLDRELKEVTRPVKGSPGVREIVGAYRPVWLTDGPFVLDDGPNARESPRMTEATPYMSNEEHLRFLGGSSDSVGDRAFASSLPEGQGAPDKSARRRRRHD